MSNYILTAEHIQKQYNGNTVLRDVSIRIKKGEIYGLVGKNGSGKTTLLRILAGLIQRYKGTVSFFAGEAGVQEIRVSAVINSPSLFLNISAFENLKAQALLLWGMYDHARIEQTLKTIGLENCKNKLARNFSLGMIQRLKLGMALLERPDILILDEPFNGLDPNGIAELRELLLQLNRTCGITILISSHILSELEQIAACIGILHDGKIVKEVFIQDIIQKGATLEELYMQFTKGGKH
jgi:ABC-type multidrug transport system ATPase subunit